MIPYSLPLAAVSVLAIIASALITYRHRERRVIAGALLVLGSSIWLMMQALEFTSDSLSIKLLFYMLRYVGVVTVPGAWLVLAMLISGYERHVNKRNIFALTIVPLLSLFLIFTNKSHNLMFSNVTLDATDPSLPLVVTFGPAYWALAVMYSYALMIVGFVMIARRTIAARRSYRVLGVQTLLIAMAPWVLNVVYVLDPSVFMNFEPSSLGISVAGAVLLWRIVDLPIMGVLPVAHEVLVDSMNDAIFVLDTQKRIVDANPKAQSLLGTSLSKTVGASIEKTWAEWPIVERALDYEAKTGREVTLGDGNDRQVYELQSSAIEGLIGNASYRLVSLHNITERKQAEERLHQSVERYYSLFDRMLDGIYRSTHKGRFVDVNPTFVKMFGYSSKQEMLDIKDIAKELYFSPEERGSHILDTGQNEVEAYRMRRKDGSEIWVEDHGSYVHDEQGNIVYHEGIMRDITERKRAQEALRESEAEYKSLFEDSPMPIWLQDQSEVKKSLDRLKYSGISDFEAYFQSHPEVVKELLNEVKIVDVNQATSRLYEAPNKEAYKEGLAGLFTEESFDSFRKQLIAMAEGSTKFQNEYTILTFSGDKKRISLTWSVAPGYEESFSRVFVSTIDITDRKKMEDELRRYSEHLEELVEERTRRLRESEAGYRRIFESSPISLWEEDFSEVKKHLDDLRSKGVKDLGGYFTEHPEDLAKCTDMVKIINVNEITLKLYGAKTVDELKIELGRFFTHEFHDKFREELVALGEGKTRFASEFDTQTLTGDIKHVSLILSVIPGYENTLAKVLVSIIDLTERKRMEEELLRSRRLAAIGETAAMVGHDLRNPLQGILGAAYYLRTKERSKLSEAGKDMLALIDEDVRRSDKIITDLLEYSREIRLEIVQTDVRSIIKDALGHVKIPKRIRVVESTKSQPTMRLDLEKMRRVFVNIIRNAVDAMPKGGTLTIATIETNGRLQITFSDTGEGMTQDTMRKLWSPLFTTKSEGMGLGLPITRRFVEAHGGSISVESKLGEGSIFTVTLATSESKPIS